MIIQYQNRNVFETHEVEDVMILTIISPTTGHKLEIIEDVAGSFEVRCNTGSIYISPQAANSMHLFLRRIGDLPEVTK